MTKYTEKEIVHLSAIDHIRKLPGHYIGGVDPDSCFICFKEILDNALDEALAKHATNVNVWVSDDLLTARVSDDGRGIPFLVNESTGLSTLASVFLFDRTSGKFDKEAYSDVSIGTHGVGATATNAMSKKFRATSFRDKQVGEVYFENGQLTKQYDIRKQTKEEKKTRPQGTVVEFEIDFSLFDDITCLDFEKIRERLQVAAALSPGLNLTLEHKGKVEKFENNGLKGLLGVDLHEADFEFPVDERGVTGTARCHFGIALGDARSIAVVNLSKTPDGGSHVTGFESAVSDFLIERAKGKCSAREILECIVYGIDLKHPRPMYSTQTKVKVINKKISSGVYDAALPALKSWARKNAAAVDDFLAKACALYASRQSAKEVKNALKEIKTTKKNSRGILPAKLFEADCKPEKRELYIVEGDSAAGSAVQGRDAGFQEILPLRGKFLNVFRASEAQALSNETIASMLAAIGGGYGNKFNIDDVRVGKIILLSDSDDDGFHISSLMMAFLAKYMPQVLEKNMVYTVDAPLFKGGLPGSKTRWFAHSMDELKLKAGKQFAKCDVTRLKGHGEANPDEVAEYAMGPTRKLIQLKWDVNAAKVVEDLMGKDMDERKALMGQEDD